MVVLKALNLVAYSADSKAVLKGPQMVGTTAVSLVHLKAAKMVERKDAKMVGWTEMMLVDSMAVKMVAQKEQQTAVKMVSLSVVWLAAGKDMMRVGSKVAHLVLQSVDNWVENLAEMTAVTTAEMKAVTKESMKVDSKVDKMELSTVVMLVQSLAGLTAVKKVALTEYKWAEKMVETMAVK